MLPRLQEIEADLLTRRARAGSEGWLGEIEGLDLTLTFLRDKRKRLERTTTRRPGGQAEVSGIARPFPVAATTVGA
jgi:hypothetical protein